MTSSILKTLISLLITLLVLSVLPEIDNAEARVGGGQRYSRKKSSSPSRPSNTGSSRGSSSSGGSSSGGSSNGGSSWGGSSNGGSSWGGSSSGGSSWGGSSSGGSSSGGSSNRGGYKRKTSHHDRSSRQSGASPSSPNRANDLWFGSFFIVIASSIFFAFCAGAIILIGDVMTNPLRAPRRRSKSHRPESSSSPQGEQTPLFDPFQVDLEALRRADPNFSRILLEDFLGTLYTRAMQARGEGREALAALAPYLRQSAREALAQRGGRELPELVEGVIVGAIIVGALQQREDRFVLIVEFESNHVETRAQSSSAYFTIERWTLERALGVTSRPPERIKALNCPQCGAPVESSHEGRCGSCDAVFGSGQFDWFVTSIEVMDENGLGPQIGLGAHPPEEGTDEPTIVAPDLQGALKELQGRDPEFDLNAVKARAEMIFMALQQAWTGMRWRDARPYLTDALWTSQSYWVETYRRKGLRNVLEDIQVDRCEVAKLDSDPFFDATTLRIWARCVDYTVDLKTDEVVAGGKQVRRFSEYWTFIRSSKATGAATTAANCPSCGAPLAINQAGQCEHCHSLIISGEFDWVLSRIEQDDSFAG